MKIRTSVIVVAFTLSNFSVSQEFISSQDGSTEPAPGARVFNEKKVSIESMKKTEAQIESEVIRYLSVQLKNREISDGLVSFLNINPDQVAKILQVIAPVEDHFTRLEVDRVAALCEQWKSPQNMDFPQERLAMALNSYESKLIEQSLESRELYDATLSGIAGVIGSQSSSEWNEYLSIQRIRMARMNTTYFHQNIAQSTTPNGSVEAICRGQ